MQKNIVIGSDHAGFELKEYFKDYLIKNGYDILDVGTDSTVSCDYPDIAQNLSRYMHDNTNTVGVLICGSGIGMSIAVNRYSFIRGALLYNTDVAKLARKHNDANVAIFGARTFDANTNLGFLKIFLESKFSGDDRHKRRIKKLADTCE